MLNNKCSLWKITLELDHPINGVFPEAPALETSTFWAYNFSEIKARDAAFRWASNEFPAATVSVKAVELRP